VLSYRDYQHPIMGEGRYTELFFLDEGLPERLLPPGARDESPSKG